MLTPENLTYNEIIQIEEEEVDGDQKGSEVLKSEILLAISEIKKREGYRSG
jgi:hypothetical protein